MSRIKEAAVRMIMRTQVTGLSFGNYTWVADQIKVNDDLVLRREPDNSSDKNAIAVWYADEKIGWIPREKNELLARLMDVGLQFKARVLLHNPNDNDFQKRLYMGIYVVVAQS